MQTRASTRATILLVYAHCPLRHASTVSRNDASLSSATDADAAAQSACHVFVYGTLRYGEINDIGLAAARHGRPELPAPVLVARGRVKGKLVDFGSWPGLLPDGASPSYAGVAPPAGTQVVGDIFRIDRALLPILDEIEGIRPDGREAFYRDEVDVADIAWLGDTPATATRSTAFAGSMQVLPGGVHAPRTGVMVKREGAACLRCFFYPVDIQAGRGLPVIPGGDWIAYRLARSGGANA